jgi:hypothetical protein
MEQYFFSGLDKPEGQIGVQVARQRCLKFICPPLTHPRRKNIQLND